LRPLQAVSSELGLINDFSPDGLYLIYPEVVLLPEDEIAAADEAAFFSHLYRVGVNSGLSVDLSGDRAGQIEDTSARYAPDGSWIAFARKFLAPDRWTPGRQIWLMRSDGEEARPLTSEPEFMHASLAWSPDSNALAYTRFNPAQFSGASEIWWLLIDGGRPNLLVEGGYLPQWVP
jgi:TolB protein